MPKHLYNLYSKQLYLFYLATEEISDRGKFDPIGSSWGCPQVTFSPDVPEKGQKPPEFLSFFSLAMCKPRIVCITSGFSVTMGGEIANFDQASGHF